MPMKLFRFLNFIIRFLKALFCANCPTRPR